MSSLKKVLIAAPVHPVLLEMLTANGYVCVMQDKITQAIAYELIADCEGVITSTRLQLDKGLIDAAVMLRWIGRMGSGMEVIDLGYAAEKGITCFASPEGNCNAVGEHALGMLLALIRHITLGHNELQQGIWKREENRGSELEGKTAGIIGYGHTGAAFAKKLSGFDMKIIAFDKYNPEKIPAGMGGQLEVLMQEADILSFHVPQHKETRHYFNESFMCRMGKPFILLNTSRGQVADMKAIHTGLISGKIVGACLDVFEQEPLQAMNEEQAGLFRAIAGMPQVIVTPHIAGYTFEALYKMSKVLAEKLKIHLDNQGR